MQTRDSHSPRLFRLAGAAGLAFVILLVVTQIVLPQIIAGNRISGTTNEATIRTYYSHQALAPLYLLMAPSAALALVLAYGLRRALETNPAARAPVQLGFYFVLANVPLYLGTLALNAVLVTMATTGRDVVALFRFWDVWYNSFGYVLEIAFLASFGIALRQATWAPRWLAWLGIGGAFLQAFNAAVIWLNLPDLVSVPGNVVLIIFFATCSALLLTRAQAVSTATEPGRPWS